VRHFLFEEKEYRINPQFKRRRNEQDSARALARLFKRRAAVSRGGNRGYRNADTRRKCVVKAQYSKSIEAHRVQLEKYLVREGTDRDGGQAKLYGTDPEEYRNTMAAKNFRIFLSPQSGEVDLKNLAERFIQKLELQTGYKLYWQGANHYNTAHPHAHLLINGVDKNGKEVAFPRDVVKTFMRETARDLCTAMIGRRTPEEMALEREQSLAAPRFTGLDRRIADLCDRTLRVRLTGVWKDRERILGRLEHLRKMNLCVYRNGGYRLSPRWSEDLQANGRYNAFLKSREFLRFTAPSCFSVYSGEGGSISGMVTKIFRTDGDASDNHALVLEGIDGRAYFVPLFKKPEMKEGERKIPPREGDLLTVTAYENQRGRLTPVIIRRDVKSLRKEIGKRGYTGGLAEAVLKGIPEGMTR
jgi:hypothetical protein